MLHYYFDSSMFYSSKDSRRELLWLRKVFSRRGRVMRLPNELWRLLDWQCKRHLHDELLLKNAGLIPIGVSAPENWVAMLLSIEQRTESRAPTIRIFPTNREFHPTNLFSTRRRKKIADAWIFTWTRRNPGSPNEKNPDLLRQEVIGLAEKFRYHPTFRFTSQH